MVCSLFETVPVPCTGKAPGELVGQGEEMLHPGLFLDLLVTPGETTQLLLPPESLTRKTFIFTTQI